MDYQIILLPRDNYWTWVSACKDYVLAFGPNMTANVETAARYMAPRQVVSFPSAPNAYPEQGDLERWFQDYHPGVRTDSLKAATPAELSQLMRARIDRDDRYGEAEKPFRLKWPTDYRDVTQPFGANPHIYCRYGLPGHEGIDLRARMDSNIYACADGRVYAVHTNPNTHLYGIHIRIQHRDGYKTIYAHLSKELVGVGDSVTRGQRIGLADSTGNSTGSHLHLTLKQDGATERQETIYPKDIIDPTPYIIFPPEPKMKGISLARGAQGKCLIGACGRIGGALEEGDMSMVKEARLEAVKISLHEKAEALEKLRSINPEVLIVGRLRADFSSDAITPGEFVSAVEGDMRRLYRLGVRHFEVHGNPNLEVEGWRRSWRSGAEFSDWYLEVLNSLREKFEKAQLGFPGLSPGGSISGHQQSALEFLEDADLAIAEADWVGVNCYWANGANIRSDDGGYAFEEYCARFPDEVIFITEFGNASHSVSAEAKGRQYLEFFRMLRNRKGIGAAFGMALSATQGYQSMVWRSEDGKIGPIPAILGGRTF
ncbi:MAG: M23 family metallopeptidase [Anaerolineales bacterium]|jgi:murein DD-endopeptidase MepM/ murein hydrolase activator NlpD